jgi:hypothetical protein
LDTANFLKEDPRRSTWRDALASVNGLSQLDSLMADHSPVSEEMNVAWANHELVSDYIDETLDFLTRAPVR